MIKVNLLGEAAAKSGGPSFSASASDKDAAKKVMFIIMAPLLLYLYESYNIDDLAQQELKTRQAVALAKKNLSDKQALAKGATKMQAEIQEIENKIEIIKELSKSRLRELKAFDTLQTIIPEKVWFQTVNYTNQIMEITGNALDDEDLTTFLRQMQERPYFSKVLLKRSQDRKVENGVIKEFFITCNVETAE